MGVDEEIADAVQAHGWQFINIFDTDPPFLYSIGLMPEHPELIIFGLDSEVATSVLHDIATRVKQGERFEHKATHEIASQFSQIAIRNVHPTQIPLHFGFAMGYCRLMRCGDVQAVQVFWPDLHGKYPFDAGCDLDIYGRQPRLDIGLTPREVAAWERQWE
jgi:hypothetical protein